MGVFDYKNRLDQLEDALFVLYGEGAILDEELDWMVYVIRDAQIDVKYAEMVRYALLEDEELFNDVMERGRKNGGAKSVDEAIEYCHQWYVDHYNPHAYDDLQDIERRGAYECPTES